jgi:hypothetical protein
MKEETRRPIDRFLTRRDLLRYGGYGLAALPLLPLARALGTGQPVASAAVPAIGRTRAGEWAVDESVRAFGAGDPVEFAAPYPFGALGAHWSAAGEADIHLAVSVSDDGTTWGPWQTLHAGGHGPAPGGPGRADRHFGELLLLAPSRAVRCRATDHAGNPRRSSAHSARPRRRS